MLLDNNIGVIIKQAGSRGEGDRDGGVGSCRREEDVVDVCVEEVVAPGTPVRVNVATV